MNIRTTMIDGEPWFVAADVCRALDIYQSTNGQAAAIMKRLADDEFRTLLVLTPHPRWVGKTLPRSLLHVAESGLYALINRSDKPEAKVFQRWVNREVLPSIRKTGSYSLADHGREAMPLPMDIAEALAPPVRLGVPGAVAMGGLPGQPRERAR